MRDVEKLIKDTTVIVTSTLKGPRVLISSLAEKLNLWDRYRVKDLGDKYIVYIELPGASKDSIKVYARERTLYVSASRATELEIEGLPKEYKVKIELNEDIDLNNTQARYRDGVLIIEAPKARKGKEIRIE